MGCEPSNQKKTEIVSLHSEQDFEISYRELVTQDRGQVFDLYHFSNIISRSNWSIVRKVVSKGSFLPRVSKIIPFKGNQYFDVLTQVQFLKKLDHPNIIQIIQYFFNNSYLYIILEQVPGNRILSELKTKCTLNFEDLVLIMQQVLLALEFCHKKNIAHRTITVDNVMLTWKDGMPIVKLIDFSQAMIFGCSSPRSIPKDKRMIIFSSAQYEDGQKLDIFDCGYLFYCLILGRKPDKTQNNQIIPNCLQTVEKLSLPKQIQQDLKSLLSSMLSLVPSQRIELSQCLQHNFFKNFIRKTNTTKPLQNLLQFHSDNNLVYLLSLYSSLNMVSTLNRSQYINQFYNLDTNKDGQIQIQELRQGLKNTFNITEQKAQEYAESIFVNLDKNKSGSLNFSEFVTGTVKLSKIYTIQSLKAIFNEMDANKDGHISQKELNNLISGIDRCNLLEGKKEVNFGEFRDIMMKIFNEDKK